MKEETAEGMTMKKEKRKFYWLICNDKNIITLIIKLCCISAPFGKNNLSWNGIKQLLLSVFDWRAFIFFTIYNMSITLVNVIEKKYLA